MKTFKKTLTIIFILVYVLTMMPMSIFAYETGGITYNDNDFNKLQTFLNSPSAVDGMTNGQCINASYNADDPATWTGVTWEADKIKTIDFQNKLLNGDLDLSNFTSLTTLNVSKNSIDSINVSSDSALTSIDCSENQLTSLNLSSCTDLTYARMTDNAISSLNITGLSSLQSLFCINNQISTLDLSTNTALKTLSCRFNNFTSLNLSNLIALEKLYCDNNPLTELNVSANTALINLDCGNTQLTSLDVSNATNLKTLSCSISNITLLDLHNNTKLTELSCANNQITSLNVSGLTLLSSINCSYNNLTSLDVSTNTALKYFTCNANPLKEIKGYFAGNIATINAMGEGYIYYLYTPFNYFPDADVCAVSSDDNKYKIKDWTQGETVVSTSNNYNTALLTGTLNVNFQSLVIFNSQDGGSYDDVWADYNNLLSEPTAPVKTGYTFVGWYTDNEYTDKWDFENDKVTQALTLYAKWELTSPVITSAALTSNNSIALVWDGLSGVTGYEVFRSTSNNDDYTKIAETSETNYTDADLVAGTNYYYKIRSYLSTGDTNIYSEFSDVKYVFITLISPEITVSPAQYNSLNINWGAVDGATGYKIYRSTSSKGTYAYIKTIADGAVTSYINTGLATGTTYYYKVLAYRTDAGKTVNSTYSAVKYAKVIPATPTATAVSASYNSVKISWPAVSGASGYTVYRSETEGGTYAAIPATITKTSYTQSSLAMGKTYYYKVRAYRTVGTTKVYGNYSEVTSAVPIPSTPVPAAVSTGYTSIKVSWPAIRGATGYKIYSTDENGENAVPLDENLLTAYYNHTSLTTNQTYYYKVIAVRTAGTLTTPSSDSVIVSAKPVPSAPTGLSAASAGYNSVNISWQEVAGAEGYALMRSNTLNGTYERINSGTFTSCTDNNLTTGTTYYYKVYAYINGTPEIKGDECSPVSVKPIPAAPVITVTATQYNSLVISWDAVDGATGYKIYRSTSSKGTYAYIKTITDGAVTSYVNSGLSTGSTYYYKVLAYRTDGTVTTNSLYSAYKYAKVIPAAPSATAASYNYNSIKISWPKVSGASGYTVYRCASETGKYAALVTTSSNSYVNTSLVTGNTYYYKVIAYRTVGRTKVYSAYSEVTSAMSVPATPAATAVSTGYNSIKISWPAVAGVSAYEVYSVGESDTFLARVTTPYFTQADLIPGNSYSYKVVAYRTMASGDVYGVYSNIVTASPVPQAPTISVLLNTYNSLNIKWNAINGADKYEISRSTSSMGIFEPIGESDTTDFIDNSLITGATYYYKVRAFIEGDPKVNGDYSAVASSKALPVAPVVTVTPTAYNSLTLSWNIQDGVTGYRIYRSTSSKGIYTLIKTVTDGSTSYINSSLAAGTTYYYKLIAYRTEGAVTTLSPYSAVKYAKVIPASPTGVSAQSASYNSIKITWDKVLGASGYTVYRLASNGTYPAIATVTTNSYTNTSLTTGTTYTYKVAAYRLVGTTKVYGAYSQIVSDWPKPATPVPKAESTGYNSVYLSWSAVSGATGYEVYLTDPQTQTDIRLTSTSSLNYTHSSLITNKQYSYKVRAYTTLGDNTVFGSDSSIISATPIPSTPQISVDLNTINSIKISWSPIGGAEGYEVLRSATIDGTYEIISTISQTEYVDSGLTLQNSYYYKVRAYITDEPDNIYSNYSAPIGRVMLPKTPNLSAASYSYNCIQLTWDSIDGATGYKIYRSTSSSGTYSFVYTITDGSTSYINPGLTAGTAYYYKVKAYTTTQNGEVYSDYSLYASARPYTTAPIITTSVPIYNNIRIDWKAVEGASGYQVYRATTLDGTYSLLADTTSLNYTNKSLAMEKTYYYKVRAYRTVGKTKVGGFYSDIESNKTRQPLKPELKLLFLTSDEDVMYPDYVGFYVFNNGPVTLTIYSQNALLYDYEYYFYDSALILADEEYVYSYVQFGPSEDGLVSFYTLEWPTRYDEYSKIYFDFKYDGIMYRGYVSNYFGFHYYKK